MRPIYLISKTPYEGVIHIPILKTRFFAPDIDFSHYEGIIVTSKQILKALEPYSEEWKALPIIAVSEPTADAFRTQGCVIAAVANGYGEGIEAIIREESLQKRWLYLRPEHVASSWAEEGRKNGVKIDEAVMYKTVCNDEASHFEIEENGVLIFASPSSINCFLQNYSILTTHSIVVIGKTTQKALPLGLSSSLSATPSIASAVELARKIAL
ncbi:MAG: uroporphyrinogen-III synthase [Sulfuricurvum sp.]|uniref:uroporphyrinogen-III synthase n=1 Tax=Sulfuricurvum sp. TaxID=2025608 RepID=UPI002719353C|nr:uroporphyrinogen-III synthase [Sulfuricurvum sp.]MDO9055163.1 uroporphyrinogen-III synthase [Sulfuricurvum sp.]